MTSPRLLLVIDLFPPIIGGAETHARDLVAALREMEVPVTVLTRLARPDLAPEETLANGARVIRVPVRYGGKRWGKYTLVPPLLKAVRALAADYDVIYLCGFRVLGWPLTGTAGKLGKPIVLRAEVLGELSGGYIWDRPGQGTSRLLRLAFQPLVRLRNRRLRRADSWLAISRAVEEEYRDNGVPTERITTIPNGIDTERFSPVSQDIRDQLRAERGLPFGEPVFAYCGKLNRGKGLEVLVEAWQGWVAEGREGRLLLVGSGGGQWLSCEEELRRQVAEHGLEERVTFAGYQQDVVPWLRAADAFVFPSEAESFGLAPLEASACGLPVITTNAGALAETVPDGEAGIAVPVGDSGALLAAMRRLTADPAERTALADRALRRVRERYSFAVVAQRHLELFRRLAAQSRNG